MTGASVEAAVTEDLSHALRVPSSRVSTQHPLRARYSAVCPQLNCRCDLPSTENQLSMSIWLLGGCLVRSRALTSMCDAPDADTPPTLEQMVDELMRQWQTRSSPLYQAPPVPATASSPLALSSSSVATPSSSAPWSTSVH